MDTEPAPIDLGSGDVCTTSVAYIAQADLQETRPEVYFDPPAAFARLQASPRFAPLSPYLQSA
jgi:hypothetical protein